MENINAVLEPLDTVYVDATPEQRTKALETLGFKIESKFVPFSKSRSAKGLELNKWKRYPFDKWKLNWDVTIFRNGKKLLTTDYSAGIAHAPAYKKAIGPITTIHNSEMLWAEVETGHSVFGAFGFKGKPIPPPALLDVMSCLTLDAQSGSMPFSEFCNLFGYDSDSRSARKTWKACAKTARKLGMVNIDSLSEIMLGY